MYVIVFFSMAICNSQEREVYVKAKGYNTRKRMHSQTDHLLFVCVKSV
jgi:5-bromo-4-chloroindolyl phosphate hydrolysis protein